ncbi:hypothetical protein [Streptomyces sp. 3214.6]|uniref:hypothetical protein n=1 Tax=Streptomyces sp. 3214.6 TaxID=1882757 RepID=UPI00090CCBF0|nr:hypothetical protein [Streptomyces sp. 3214.6]SHI65941.1 hypothetical protein SAMN05444521_8162 [Streptomyces sp. 3214.6]
MTWVCPRGGCDAYGYCPCAEEPPDEADLEQAAVIAQGQAIKVGGRVRSIDTLPPLDTYEPPEAT